MPSSADVFGTIRLLPKSSFPLSTPTKKTTTNHSIQNVQLHLQGFFQVLLLRLHLGRASTHSSVSTATTLKGMDMHKKKWYSLSSKSHPKHANDYYVKKALHNEAVASYFSMR
ncbi:hypothetical protein POX_a00765 [Penicillium oxalicum]|uniref:hypothetical protein n=1 Tax=Penicillium oxalicum TaxID=69781 RepID=UPI0020B7EC43|nr:hypothetical protein POX_a00765 [Penicillium oxalicum]KAI2794175.1 hypothetical protein POX_a00765 [Penicillium oxalicum]